MTWVEGYSDIWSPNSQTQRIPRPTIHLFFNVNWNSIFHNRGDPPQSPLYVPERDPSLPPGVFTCRMEEWITLCVDGGLVHYHIPVPLRGSRTSLTHERPVLVLPSSDLWPCVHPPVNNLGDVRRHAIETSNHFSLNFLSDSVLLMWISSHTYFSRLLLLLPASLAGLHGGWINHMKVWLCVWDPDSGFHFFHREPGRCPFL